MFELDSVTEPVYSHFADKHPKDTFKRHFIYQAGLRGYWPYAIGCWEGVELLGVLIVTFSKREPKVATLQLLHVFHSHRGKGAGRFLADYAIQYAFNSGCAYFRISSEPRAVKFYEALGIRFWGKQKWGYSLSVFKIGGASYLDAIYDDTDPYIHQALYSGKAGSLWLTTDSRKTG